MKTLYLCGFMGCGKSHCGRIIARRLKLPFIDLDEYIVKKEGMTIPEIFEKKGEPYFRNAERESLGELSGAVIATGGGALLSEENAEIAKRNGTVLFLDVPFDICYARIRGDKNRPLAVNNTKEKLSELFNKRREQYLRSSDLTVVGGGAERALRALGITEDLPNADL